MPHINNDGITYFKQTSAYDPDYALVDRGPDDGCLYHVFEIETSDRVFTLYSVDADLIQTFVWYLSQMVKMKEEMIRIDEIDQMKILRMNQTSALE